MSDRCRIEVHCRREDAHKFIALGFVETDPDDDDPICELTDDEANYGHGCELEELAEEGIPFWGGHGPGETYEPEDFCSWVGDYYPVVVDLECIPLVRVLDDGTVDEDDLRAVHEYQEARRAVTESFDDISAKYKAEKAKEAKAAKKGKKK